MQFVSDASPPTEDDSEDPAFLREPPSQVRRRDKVARLAILPVLRRRLAVLSSRLPIRTPYFIGILIIAVAELALLFWFQGQAYLSFQASSGDLGQYNQSFYTTLLGHLFYSTVALPSGTNGSVFAIHFVPFYFVVLPFYAIAPTAQTLILIKEAAIVFAALPLFGLARLKLRSERWAALVATTYLIAPITMSFDWTNFDPEAFYPLTFFSLFYFQAKGKAVPLVAAWIVAISVEETAAAILLVYAAACLIGNLLHRPASPFVSLKGERRILLVFIGIGTVWLGAAYYVLSKVNAAGGTFGQAYGERFTKLGATSIPGIPIQIITHPSNAMAALSYQPNAKLLYLVLLLACAGFLPLIGGMRYLTPLLGWFAFTAFSNSATFYSFGAEFPGYVLPFLFAGLIGGILTMSRWLGPSEAPVSARKVDQAQLDHAAQVGRVLREGRERGAASTEGERRFAGLVAAIRRGEPGEVDALLATFAALKPSGGIAGASSMPRAPPPSDQDGPLRNGLKELRRGEWPSSGSHSGSFGPSPSELWRPFQIAIAVALALCLISVSVVASPLGVDPEATVPWFQYGETTVTMHDRLAQEVIDLIPNGAAVLTTAHLFSQVSSRIDAYVMPEQGFIAGSASYQSVANHFANLSDFILIDYVTDVYGAIYVEGFVNLSSFGVLAAVDGTYLYERGWTTHPELLVPFTATFSPSDLTAERAHLDAGVSSVYGPSLSYQATTNLTGEKLWNGPGYLPLPPGNYSATFWMQLMTKVGGSQLKLEVFENAVKLTANAYDVTSDGRHYSQNITRDPGNSSILNSALVNVTTATTSIEVNETLHFSWSRLGYLELPAVILPRTFSLYFFEVSVSQISAD